jgi:hypothetical protein
MPAEPRSKRAARLGNALDRPADPIDGALLERLRLLQDLLSQLSGLSPEQRLRWAELERNLGEGLLDMYQRNTGMVLWQTADEAPANVDPEAEAADRIKALWKIISWVIETWESSKLEPSKKAVKLFLLRIAWHESQRLTRRVQGGGGPARGLFQFEVAACLDVLKFARDKHPAVFGGLATVNEISEDDLKKALKDLQDRYDKAVEVGKTPQFLPDNAITKCLLDHDAFAAILARYFFRRFSGHSTPDPDDIPGTAENWFDWYSRTPKPRKKADESQADFDQRVKEWEAEVKKKKDNFQNDAKALEEERAKIPRDEGGTGA